MTDLPMMRGSVAPEEPDFALRALRIIFFTGFAVVAVVLGFVFLPLAGAALALLAAWLGFRAMIWTDRSRALRALSLIGFTAFATVATVLAFVFLAPVGLLLAAIFLWRGFAGFAFGTTQAAVAPQVGASPQRSGNSAFDAFKADTLQRLEEEQMRFEAFLDRLRAAKDKSEFDAFMESRAARARNGHGAEGSRTAGA
ncbi:DUF2852 domain-containing protein [Frigidibacter sp. SLM-1]|nr:DUF2852 domain-containing protein [Frigidibacter sp. ROC022]MCR8723792.1 DUF2852 domain-containing protein [Frigidibacter sp. ROC022]